MENGVEENRQENPALAEAAAAGHQASTCKPAGATNGPEACADAAGTSTQVPGNPFPRSDNNAAPGSPEPAQIRPIRPAAGGWLDQVWTALTDLQGLNH